MKKKWQLFAMDPYYYITKNPSYKLDTIHEQIHFDKIIRSGVEIFNVIEFLLTKYNITLKNHNILDYACGYGRLSILLALKYKQVFVYDFVEEYCQILSKNASLLNIDNIHIFDCTMDITKKTYALVTAPKPAPLCAKGKRTAPLRRGFCYQFLFFVVYRREILLRSSKFSSATYAWHYLTQSS